MLELNIFSHLCFKLFRSISSTSVKSLVKIKNIYLNIPNFPKKIKRKIQNFPIDFRIPENFELYPRSKTRNSKALFGPLLPRKHSAL